MRLVVIVLVVAVLAGLGFMMIESDADRCTRLVAEKDIQSAVEP